MTSSISQPCHLGPKVLKRTVDQLALGVPETVPVRVSQRAGSFLRPLQAARWASLCRKAAAATAAAKVFAQRVTGRAPVERRALAKERLTGKRPPGAARAGAGQRFARRARRSRRRPRTGRSSLALGRSQKCFAFYLYRPKFIYIQNRREKDSTR